MRKILFKLLQILILISLILSWTACKNKPITVDDVIVEFWFSNDGGETYFQGDGYHRGWDSSFYMKVRIQVHTDSDKATFPTVSLHIGDSENITAYIIGGPVVNPRRGLSSIIYDFNTRAIKYNDNFTELFVEFIPHKPGPIEMEIEFEFNGKVLDNFKVKHGINFMCLCEQIERDIFGEYQDYDKDIFDEYRRLNCNCEIKDCKYCNHD